MSFDTNITVGYGFVLPRTKENLELLALAQSKRSGATGEFKYGIEDYFINEWLAYKLFQELSIEDYSSEGANQRSITVTIRDSTIRTSGKDLDSVVPTVLTLGDKAEEGLKQLRELATELEIGDIESLDSTRFNWLFSKSVN